MAESTADASKLDEILSLLKATNGKGKESGITDDRKERRLTPEEWVTRGKVKGKLKEPSEATKSLRRLFVDIYAMANGKPIEEVVAGIKTTTQLYESARNVMEYCKSQNFAVGTTAEYRTMIPGFLSEVFGSIFKKEDFEEEVPFVESKVTHQKHDFDHEMLTRLLENAPDAKVEAFLYVIAYGFRPSEVLRLRLSDIENKGDYVVVKLWATGDRATKTRESRRMFIAKEGFDKIKAYRAQLQDYQKASDWVFPGELTKKKMKKGLPLSHAVLGPIRKRFKKLCKALGLEDTENEIFSPHGLRSFGLDTMRQCGLSDTYARQITGHDTGTEENYKRWPAIERAWVEKCLEPMTWSSSKSELITAQTKKLRRLEDQSRLQQQVILGLAEKAGVSVEELLKTGAIKMGQLSKLSQQELEELDQLEEQKQLEDKSDGQTESEEE